LSRRPNRWLALAGLAFALAGCSHSAGTPAATAGYPIEIHTASGAVTIPSRPVRIVSISPTATETLFAIGAGHQVVAVDSYSNYPPQAPKTSLSGYRPNVEAIAKYNPDLVVLAEDPGGVVDHLKKLHIPTLLLAPASNLADVYQQITQLGDATGHASGAERLVAQMRGQIADIVRSVPPPARRITIYHELEPTLFSATSQTFIGQLYVLLGLRNIADGASSSTEYPQLSAEYVIAHNPDMIVLADTVCCGQTPATVRARPGWQNLTAVKNGNVVPVEDAIASEWGPRVPVFLQTVATAVKKVEAQQR
jgi:iron complex transport system substrate-binding protein